MRAGVIIAVLIIGTTVVTGCGTVTTTSSDSIKIQATGKVNTQNLSLDGFDRIEAHHAFDLTIEQGDSFSVMVRIDEAVEDYLDVSVKGDALILTLDDQNSYSLSGNITMDATITLPTLVGLELSGASSAHLIGIESGQAFDGTLSGASRVSGELIAGDVQFGVSGASRVALKGEAQDLNLELSGASDAGLVDLQVENATVAASGSSSADITVLGTLDAEASGASHITYAAGATLERVDTSGSSSVTARS